eukprot:11546941-Alexandrium_andersonii.AAC.1
MRRFRSTRQVPSGSLCPAAKGRGVAADGGRARATLSGAQCPAQPFEIRFIWRPPALPATLGHEPEPA